EPTVYELPAVAADLPPGQFDLVLPPQVLDELGLTTEVAGFVAATSRMPTQAEEDAMHTALRDLSPNTVAHLDVERGFTGEQPLVLLVLIGAAFVVGLGSTGIS